MFTGIIEETARIKRLVRKGDVRRLEILTKRPFDSVAMGDSISINGVCLTLICKKGRLFSFDVMQETYKKTTISHWKNGDVVNVERALRVNSRVEGHFVLGHVDSVQKITVMKKEATPYMDIAISRENRGHFVKKGSISVDGISLTIGEIRDNRIRIFLIPFTLRNTNLRYKKTGDWVNMEFDILGKYSLHTASHEIGKRTPVTEELLKAKGFI